MTPPPSVAAGPGGEDLVAHEDVLPCAPCRVGAADESGTSNRLDVTIQRIQVVLVLRDELRVLRAASLDAVADVENHQTLVPVAQVGQPVLHIDVVHVVSGLVGPGLPPGHLPRLVRIPDVDHPKRAGRVVGEIHVAPVDEGAVHTTGDGLSELRDRLGCAGSSNERMTIPFFRVEAFSRVSTPYLPSSVVIMSLMVRASTTTESVITRTGRVAHVDGVHPVARWCSGSRAGRRGGARTRLHGA